MLSVSFDFEWQELFWGWKSLPWSQRTFTQRTSSKLWKAVRKLVYIGRNLNQAHIKHSYEGDTCGIYCFNYNNGSEPTSNVILPCSLTKSLCGLAVVHIYQFKLNGGCIPQPSFNLSCQSTLEGFRPHRSIFFSFLIFEEA